MIHKKKKEECKFQLFRPYSRPISAVSGVFRPVPAVFRPVSAVSTAGRYDSIRPDFGQINPSRRESKPIRHESSRIGVNPRKKKKNRRGSTRGQPRRTPRPASRSVGRGCGTSGAASVLSSFQLGPHKALVPMASLPSSIRNIGLLSKQISSKLSKPFFIQFLPSNLLTILTSHLSLKILSLMMLHILGPLVYVMCDIQSHFQDLC